MSSAKVAAGTLAGVMEAAQEIARARRDLLARMRAALKAGNDSEALKFARELCGLDEHEQTRNRVN
jgi:hypothetical protein